MFRRLPLAVLLICVLCLANRVEADRPNIVVFLVDDMGVMDTSVPFLTDDHGNAKRYPLNDYYRTPNMQRLADQGIRFSNFYAMSVCSPTRNSIMTGQNAARHGTTTWINPETNNRGPMGPENWNWRGLRKDTVTLPKLMSAAGYTSIHVGKAHFGPTEFDGSDPLQIGFDINVGGTAIGAPASYHGEKNYGNGQAKRRHRAVPHLEKYHGTATFLTEALTIEAKRHVADCVAADKPFYLNMAHYAVHAPFDSDPRFAANYVDSGKPANAQAFATLIEGMDKSLGDLLDHLNDLGVAENTLVLFLGDNGSDAPLGHQHAVACAAPLRGKKGAHYEGGMRVPFIAAWAQPNRESKLQQRLPIPNGVIQSAMGNVCDLMPTIMDVAQVDAPKEHLLDGSPLNRLIAGQPDPDHAKSFLMHFPHSPHRSEYFTVLRDGKWKVIYHYHPTDQSDGERYQLFDLETDPFEQTNLASSQPEALASMMKKLITALEDHGAQYPVTKDRSSELRPALPLAAKITD
ncbi:sulfatase [Planctomycetes bacterium K23_9]|uniref:Arylsulfatase n=1 Tax=Stieleria marina TaxID=1930275 RepID=A0A517NRN4_9BACT|nr:Arylsulfatase [Planctomycetes bacterium K23_9]